MQAIGSFRHRSWSDMVSYLVSNCISWASSCLWKKIYFQEVRYAI